MGSATFAPTFLNGGQLTVNIPALLIDQDGPLTFTVEIYNSSQGGFLGSNSQTFAITTPPFRASPMPTKTISKMRPCPCPAQFRSEFEQLEHFRLPSGLTYNSKTGLITGTIAARRWHRHRHCRRQRRRHFRHWYLHLGRRPVPSSLSQTSATEGSSSFALTSPASISRSARPPSISSAQPAQPFPASASFPWPGAPARSSPSTCRLDPPARWATHDRRRVPGSSGTVVSNSETFTINAPSFTAIPYSSTINSTKAIRSRWPIPVTLTSSTGTLPDCLPG